MKTQMLLPNIYIVASIISLTISHGKLTTWTLLFMFCAFIYARNSKSYTNKQ